MKPLAPSLVPKILFPLQFFETTAWKTTSVMITHVSYVVLTFERMAHHRWCADEVANGVEDTSSHRNLTPFITLKSSFFPHISQGLPTNSNTHIMPYTIIHYNVFLHFCRGKNEHRSCGSSWLSAPLP
jgi:hypothetical protein